MLRTRDHDIIADDMDTVNRWIYGLLTLDPEGFMFPP